MFYVEEDVQPAVDMAKKLFGKVGSMSLEKNTMHDVSIATREFGKLWYGDLTMDTATLVNKMSELGTAINQHIYILDEKFDFDQPVLKINI